MTASRDLSTSRSDDGKKTQESASWRVGIGHALVDHCSAERACAAILAHVLGHGEASFVVTPNAQHIVMLQSDEQLRKIYNRAGLVIADGVSILLAARLYGQALPARLAGVDIVQRLCHQASELGLNVFFLGGRPGSADAAAEVMRRKFPALQCATFCPPFGFEGTSSGLDTVAEAVRRARPDILFVGLGAPKQERWIHDHGLKLGVPVCIGVGGSFEMIGGIVPRAPLWMQEKGFEWMFRLVQEPRRMWRRYLIGNAQFLLIVASQFLRRLFLAALIRLAQQGMFGAEIDELIQGDNLNFLLTRFAETKASQSEKLLAVAKRSIEQAPKSAYV